MIALGVLGVMMMAAVIGVVAMDDDGVADAAVGDTFVDMDGRFEILDNSNVKLIEYLGGDNQYTIPSQVTNWNEDRTYTVTEIGNYTFDSRTNLHYIIIPDSVTSIGKSAFENCTNLISATIPHSVTTIGSFAFASCYALTSNYIPEGLTKIGDYTFAWCTSLTSVIIPGSVEDIGVSAFTYCTGLESVTFSEGLQGINGSAFEGCSALTTLTIPSSVSWIYDSFVNCSNLSELTFLSESSPELSIVSFATGTTIDVYTPGWDPVTALADAHDSDTTIVWANPPAYPDLTFTSNPVTNGTLTYNPLRTNKTALTA